jgi:hypothetical protein
MGCLSSKELTEEVRALSSLAREDTLKLISCPQAKTSHAIGARHPSKLSYLTTIGADDPSTRLADLQIKQDAHAERAEIKLLLLGAGESGKTTIRNQMRFLEGQPMSETEKDQFSACSAPRLALPLSSCIGTEGGLGAANAFSTS